MPDLNLYWGELHNHNELGYAQGSLERSYEIARSHLDFYAFTPHGLHADGGVPDGYPGGYGLGLTGIWAAENSRAALFDALQKRRTTAVTGDRIEVCFRAGEAWMGEVVSGSAERRLDYRVEGWDALKSVEVVRDNFPVHIEVPDYSAPRATQPQPYRLRFEWGWGPMKGYQVYDWQGQLQVEGGRLLQVVPCFSSDPFDEVRRKRVLEWNEKRCAWQSHTSRGSVFTTRNGSTAPRANDALCVEVEGTQDTRIELEFDCRTSKSLLATATDWSLTGKLGGSRTSFSIGELLRGRQGWRVDGLPTFGSWLTGPCPMRSTS